MFVSANTGFASEADALAISRNIQTRHLPFGTILDPVFSATDSSQIVAYTRCGDSAIWTGHYLAAEAFRYKVTGSQDALANVKTAITGIKTLSDVTGYNLLARCLVPLSSPYAQSIMMEERHNGIYINSAAQELWAGNTSRDQYSGVFFGLAVAYDMVDDAGVRSSIKDEVTLLLDYLRGHNWSPTMPNGSISTTFLIRPDQELSFLQVGRHVNPDHYSAFGYDIDKITLAAGVITPIAVEVTDNNSYFKFNLDYINLYDLIRLEGSGSFRNIYNGAYSVLRNHTKDQQNAFFNMIDRALNGPYAARDAETVSMLDAWLQRPKRDVPVDLRGKLPSCNTPDEACSPVPVSLRPTTDFLWQRNPYMLAGAGSGTTESAGIDYILPYWMARLYGVVSANAIVSAASGSGVVSTESIVSFYGLNLASATVSATTVLLPATLGGVSVQVKDSTGAARLAPLFYVSGTQINFEIPPGTAAGQASFTIVDAGNATLASGTGNVSAIAPALFTADGTGKGVAAALVTPAYLSLYGTGIRNRSSLANVSVTIQGTSAPVLFAGAQGGYVGLDQVNVTVPLSLRGSGETDLVLTVDGQTANTVRVNIQ
ncbi:MAG: hypothetical protein ACR2NN_03305 [Bryobacteraceae bacterium]